MEGHSSISSEILGSYAADAARGVTGVRGLAEGALHRPRGIKVTTEDGAVAVELHLCLEWGANVPEVGGAVQQRVAEYLERMADVAPVSVDVVVDEIGPPPTDA